MFWILDTDDGSTSDESSEKSSEGGDKQEKDTDSVSNKYLRNANNNHMIAYQTHNWLITFLSLPNSDNHLTVSVNIFFTSKCAKYNIANFELK